jgi:methionyl-tRNA synthetase
MSGLANQSGHFLFDQPQFRGTSMSDPQPVPAGQPNPTPNAAAAAPATPPAAAAPGAAVPAAAPEGVALISIDDFFKTKLVTGEVISAVAHPKADRLLILQVKVGERTKQIVSGIRKFYQPEQMVGKTIIIVDNLQPTKLRGEDSAGMLLAVSTPDGNLRLVTTDGPAASGLEVK